MRKHTIKMGLVSTTLALAVAGNAAVFALPIKGPIHSPLPVTTVPAPTPAPSTGASGSDSSGTGTATSPQPTPANGTASAQQPLTAPEQQTCQDRAAAINGIMSRIDTRTQNQIMLFGTIATRIENFYTSKSKPVNNYAQLTTAITAAKAQAGTDLAALQAGSTIDCGGSDPKGTVTAFQNGLKTETADLQSYRTAVENLIKAVAAANGVTVSNPSQSTTGGQQ
ncbi:MAG TPA: hypothetical protein VGM08_04275 [Candidatus Saccharimonadales bacterium]|jgi:hypothetical protein